MLGYVAQGIGIFGLLFAIISFQQNTNKSIMLYQVLASVAFVLHFTLLGAYTGSAMHILGIARNLIIFNREKNWANKMYWLYVFIALNILAGAITYKNYYSILPLIGMILATIGFWIKNPKYTRLVILPGSPCWLIYNIVNLSIAGILTEIFVISSVVIGMIRFDYSDAKEESEII